MSGGTFQVITRQMFAVPMDGGLLIAGRFTTTTVHTNQESGRPYRSLPGSGYSSIEAGEGNNAKAGYCCCGILMLIWAMINIYMIIIGAVGSCSLDDHYIKIYLIVQGSFNLLHLILCILSVCASAKDKEGILSICLNCCNLILILFLIAWTIAGSVWVWRSLDDWQDDRHKCNDALFISATICVSLHYVVMLLLCCCCACAIFQMCNSEDVRA